MPGRSPVNAKLAGDIVGPEEEAGRPGVASLLPVNANCRYCGIELKNDGPKRDRGFCKARHRLLFWAAGEIVKDLAAGRAEALRPLIEEIVDKPGRKVPGISYREAQNYEQKNKRAGAPN